MSDKYAFYKADDGEGDFGSGGPMHHYESDEDEDERIEDYLNQKATARSLPFSYQQRKDTTPPSTLTSLTRSNLKQFDVQQREGTPPNKNVIWKNLAVRGQKEEIVR